MAVLRGTKSWRDLLAEHEKAGGESWGVDVEVGYPAGASLLRQLIFFPFCSRLRQMAQ